jgi:hypothetical protein
MLAGCHSARPSAPHKTPNFDIKQARMHRDGVTTVLIEHFQPAKYLLDALAA